MFVRSWRATTRQLLFRPITGEGKDVAVVFISHLTLHIGGGRFCHRVGRHHKNNNVFWSLDLLTRWCATQGCMDPDCKGYKYDVPIPSHLLPNQVPEGYKLLTVGTGQA